MADLTASMVDICDYLYELLLENQEELELAGVYYGDQENIPATPIVCVEPDEKPRTLKSAQRMTNVEFNVYIIIYHSAVTSSQENRRNADVTAEKIEQLIHTKRSLDGLVIHGMVTQLSSGYANRSGTLIRASRLTYYAQSQQLLPWTG